MAAPANDNFADAAVVAIPTDGATFTSSAVLNSEATLESGEPAPTSFTSGRSVWWKYTPQASGTADFDTILTGGDTEMAIYTGESLAGLTKIAYNSDGGSGFSSVISGLSVTSGTTYYVQVNAYNSVTLSYVLRVTGPRAATTTFTTITGEATAAGGSATMAGLATMATLAASASAAGGVGALTATTPDATFATIVGQAVAAGGVGALLANADATFATVAGPATASGGASSMRASVPEPAALTWRETLASDDFLADVNAPVRTGLGWRVDMVNQSGDPVVAMPADSVSVRMQGDSPEMFEATFTITDRTWVPVNPASHLAPTSGLRARIWWLLGDWEALICTVHLAKPRIRDDGTTVQITATGRDPVSVVRRAGYNGQLISVGGKTVTAAIERMLEVAAPTIPRRIAESSVTLPGVMELGEEDFWDDLTEIAALAGFEPRTERDGTLTIDEPPAPERISASFQEGIDCVMLPPITRDIDTDTHNRFTVVASSVEVETPISYTAECTDQGSPYWVGRYGPFTKRIDSDKVASLTAATNLAWAEYRKGLNPTEEVTISAPQRPDLDYLDRCQVGREAAGVGGEYRVLGWRMNLRDSTQEPEPMQIDFVVRETL